MPKLKTRKAAAKRFKATGTGKFTRRRAFRNHLLDHKTLKQASPRHQGSGSRDRRAARGAHAPVRPSARSHTI